MKMRNLLIVAVMSAIAFTSCRDNNRTVDDDRIELEADRNSELRTNDQAYQDDRNSVSNRIRENQNLSTFSENMNRNQVTMGSRTTGQGTTTGSQTGTTTGNQTGTTTGSQTGTTTGGQTGTTTGQNQTGTTTGGQTGTTTGQGQAGTTGNSNLNSPQAGQGQTGQAGQRTYTIFAPSNDAYEGLSETDRNAMMDTQNRDRNTASINYLMVEERLTEESLRQQIQNSNGSHTIRTMQGENITATLENDEIVLRDGAGNQARITETDTGASDGIVHVIDGVLRPQDPSKNEAANRMNRNNNNTGTQTDMERSTNTTGARSQ